MQALRIIVLDAISVGVLSVPVVLCNFAGNHGPRVEHGRERATLFGNVGPSR